VILCFFIMAHHFHSSFDLSLVDTYSKAHKHIKLLHLISIFPPRWIVHKTWSSVAPWCDLWRSNAFHKKIYLAYKDNQQCWLQSQKVCCCLLSTLSYAARRFNHIEKKWASMYWGFILKPPAWGDYRQTNHSSGLAYELGKFIGN